MIYYVITISTLNDGEYSHTFQSYECQSTLENNVAEHLKSENYWNEYNFGNIGNHPQKLNFSDFENITSISILPLMDWVESNKL